MSKAIATLANLMLELEKQSELYEADQKCKQIVPKLESDKAEKKAEELKPLSPDQPSQEIKPKMEDGAKGEAPEGPKGDGESTLKAKDATEQADMKVKVEEAGNKPLSAKSASEIDNTRKELKPLEADQASTVKVVKEESGNKPVAAATPGEQRKLDEPAEKKAAGDADTVNPAIPEVANMRKAIQAQNAAKTNTLAKPPVRVPAKVPIIPAKKAAFVKAVKKASLLNKIAALIKQAKVLSPDDKPTNTPKEIHAEGTEATTLSSDDSRKATEQASDALGKATKGFTMGRSQDKGVDPSAIHTERGSGRDQDPKKIASLLVKLAKAKSKSQQRLMGLVHSVQKGEQTAPSGEVAEIAKEMSPKAVTDYAETKQKGLPEKKAGLAEFVKALKGLGRFGVESFGKPVAGIAAGAAGAAGAGNVAGRVAGNAKAMDAGVPSAASMPAIVAEGEKARASRKAEAASPQSHQEADSPTVKTLKGLGEQAMSPFRSGNPNQMRNLGLAAAGVGAAGLGGYGLSKLMGKKPADKKEDEEAAV